MALLVALSAIVALLTVVPAPPAAAVDDDTGRDLVSGSWNMQGERDGTGGPPESRWLTGVRQMFRDGVDVAALQEAGSGPPGSSTQTDRVFSEPGVTEHVYRFGSTDVVNIYWADVGQQRNGLAIVTRETVQDAVMLLVHSGRESRPMMGVLIDGTWYFSVHALSRGGVDAAAILDRAYNFVRLRSPGAQWQVLGDFNRNPAGMASRFQRHIVRSDEPTQYSGDELDFGFFSNGTDRTVTAQRRGADSDHWYVRFSFNAGCRGLRAAAATSVSSGEECDGPVPGTTYRVRATSGKWSDQVITSGESLYGDIPFTDQVNGDATSQTVEVLFSVRPGRYVLRMGKDRCITRDQWSQAVWYECARQDKDSDWVFSGGNIVDPNANGPSFLQPVANSDFPDDPYLMARTEPYHWQFEEIEDNRNRLDIRAMPLGDSITAGVASSDGDGYRSVLYSALEDTVGAGRVDFVGSARRGRMSDPDNEGHPGRRIDEIASIADCTVDEYQPNVITLHAGTNDFNQNFALSSAPQRMKNLITQALADSPKAVVVVAKVITTGKPGLQPRIDAFNATLPGIVSDLRADGKHVVLVETSDIEVSEGLQNDAHPDDGGYAKLGGDFYQGVMEAADQGWIKKPDPQKSASGCQAQDDPSDDPSSGTALGDGWRRLGVIAPGMQRPASYDRTELAEMNGDDRADYVQIRKDGSIRVAINTKAQPGKPDWKNWGGGTGEFSPAGTAGTPDSNLGSYVRFADIDGNGRDDYLVVLGSDDESMLVDVWLNLSGDDGRPTWSDGMPRLRIPMKNAKLDHIRFADVTGDGRDDVLRVGDTGEVHAYFNIRTPGSLQPLWSEKLSWAPGVAGANLNLLRFADVDNDGKADYLMVGADGSVHAYLNKGGKDAGGFEGHRNFANASNYPRKYVQFKDISGDGRADYVVIYDGGAIRAWLNRGGNTPPPPGPVTEPEDPPQGPNASP
ncbi:FG-GAP-like repeat-containing protein [Streptomyces sp. NBC_01390]|uniref:FG-GAP-like repeat-containing protein n=1 Tax=Streptomyces sp. NBC_01390 TaxID=2903850 RepID=UPI003250D6B9